MVQGKGWLRCSKVCWKFSLFHLTLSNKGQFPSVTSSQECAGFCVRVWCTGLVGSCPAVSNTIAGSFSEGV